MLCITILNLFIIKLFLNKILKGGGIFHSRFRKTYWCKSTYDSYLGAALWGYFT
jgi:phage gp46-like protein